MENRGQKRKASAIDAPPVQAAAADPQQQLQNVTDALANVTRVGAPLASGSSAHVPYIGLALRGAVQELHVPPGPSSIQEIKAHASVTSESVWIVNGDLVEVRNPRWATYVDTCVDAMREPLGIAPRAIVNVSMSKLVLVEAGGVLPLDDRQDATREKEGVFGRLVIALPSTFVGGSLEVNQSPLQDTMTGSIEWRPDARENEYDVAFAAVYDESRATVNRIESGVALFLLYDLITTTPSEVPFYGGKQIVQNAVDEAITQYFMGSPQVKRLKLQPVHWTEYRTEFPHPRVFVHLVDENSFDALGYDDQKIAASLAAFCGSSQGKFELYHCGVLCSRDESKIDMTGTKFTLKAPWWRHGDSVSLSYPPIMVDPTVEVSQVNRVHACAIRPSIASGDYKIIRRLYGETDDAQVVYKHALVVLPSSYEHSLLAEIPLQSAVERIQTFITAGAHDEAVRYAYQVAEHCTKWRTSTKAFDGFLASAVQLNDRGLFSKMLQGIENYEFNATSLRAAIEHFGWNTCEPILIDLISSTGRSSSIALVASVLDESSEPKRISKLLKALLKVEPWTEADPVTSNHLFFYSSIPDCGNFARVLALARGISRQMLNKMVKVKNVEFLSRATIPALERLVSKPGVGNLLSLVRDVETLLKKTMDEVDLKMYKDEVVEKHCAKCDEFQAFLASNKMKTTLRLTSDEFYHLRDVNNQMFKYPKGVTIESCGSNIASLEKNSKLDDDHYYNELTRYKHHADQILKKLLEQATAD